MNGRTPNDMDDPRMDQEQGEGEGGGLAYFDGEKLHLRVEIPKPYAPEMTEILMGTLDLAREAIDLEEDTMALVGMEGANKKGMAAVYEFETVEPAVYEGMRVWMTDALPEGTLYFEYGVDSEGEAIGWILSLPNLIHEVEAAGMVGDRTLPWPTFPDGWYRIAKNGDHGFGMNEFVTPVKEERVANGGGVRVIDFLMPPAPSGWMVERVWVLREEQRGAVLSHVETTLGSIEEYGQTGIPPEFIEQLRAIKEALE